MSAHQFLDSLPVDPLPVNPLPLTAAPNEPEYDADGYWYAAHNLLRIDIKPASKGFGVGKVVITDANKAVMEVDFTAAESTPR